MIAPRPTDGDEPVVAHWPSPRSDKLISGSIWALTSALLIAVSADSGARWAAVVLSVGLGVVAWLYGFRPSVRLTDSAMIIQNPYRRFTIARADITAVRATYDGIEISTAQGTKRHAFVLQRDNLSALFRRHTKADTAAAEILAWAREGQPPD